MTNTNHYSFVGRAWKDCPECHGMGKCLLPSLGFAGDSARTVDESYRPCLTCCAHFEAVDRAVEEERRACEEIARENLTHESGQYDEWEAGWRSCADYIVDEILDRARNKETGGA